MVGAVDVNLVARGAVERASPVGADLGADPVLAQERECSACGGAACEIQVERPLPSPPQVKAACGVEERRQLGSAVAFPCGGYLRKLFPDVPRGRQSVTPSSARSRRFTEMPADPYAPIP